MSYLKSISKKITLIVLVLFLLLTGCKQEEEPDGTPTGEQQIILIWWNLFEPQENVQHLIDEYQSQHPNVTIQYQANAIETSVSEYKNTLERVLNDSDTLTTPDIFTIHNTWVGKYEAYVTKAPEGTFEQSDLEDYYDVVQGDFFDDGVIGMPSSVDTIAIIYNKKLLNNAGYTVPSADWSEFQTQAINIADHDEYGEVLVGGFSAGEVENNDSFFEIINLLLMQNGVTMIDEDVKQATFASQSETQGALDFYKSFAKGQTPSWNEKMNMDVASFLENKLAMIAGPTWRLKNVLEYNSNYSLGLDVGVAPMPQLRGAESVHWASYWGSVVSNETSEPEVAWDFIKFINQDDQLKSTNSKIVENGRPFGIIYPKKSLAGETSSDTYLGPYTASIMNAKNWWMYDGYEIEIVFKEYMIGTSNLEELEVTVNNIISNL